MKSHKTGLAHFFSAFKYSMKGLRVALRETAIRHELYLGIVHFIALSLLPIGWLTGLYLSALWVITIVVEMLNTAVENVIDLVSPEYNELAGKAKDLGSAAVFLMLVLFIAGWAITIWKGVMS